MCLVEGQFISFMTCVAIGVRKNYYKKLALEAARVFLFSNLTDDMQTMLGSTAMELLTNDDLFENEKLSLALDTLTKKQRNILFKTVVDEMTETEVAKMLRISHQCVNATKKKAKNKLKKFLEKGGKR